MIVIILMGVPTAPVHNNSYFDFNEPNAYENWETYINTFEKTAEHHDIPEEKWSKVLPDMLRGQAKFYLEGQMKSLKRNLTYKEIGELMKRIFRAFDIIGLASDKLAQ